MQATLILDVHHAGRSMLNAVKRLRLALEIEERVLRTGSPRTSNADVDHAVRGMLLTKRWLLAAVEIEARLPPARAV